MFVGEGEGGRGEEREGGGRRRGGAGGEGDIAHWDQRQLTDASFRLAPTCLMEEEEEEEGVEEEEEEEDEEEETVAKALRDQRFPLPY